MNFFKNIFAGEDRSNYYLMLLMFYCAALRLLTPQIIGYGGDDAVESWGMARVLYYNADYYFIHRTVRFGTIIPIYLTQLLFGTHPIVYYVAPAIASFVQVFFLFKISTLIRGPLFAFLCGLLYLTFPQTLREFSHPRVSVFETMFFLIAFYFVIKFYLESNLNGKDSKPWIGYLFISGINIFLMYMAKEDSLYFLPALILVVFMSRKRFTDVVLLGILPFSLFIGETVIYLVFTDFPFGRLSVITGPHFETVAPLYSWFSLFDRYTGKNLRPYFRFPLFVSLIIGVYILIKKIRTRDRNLDTPVFIVISLFTFLIFLTFLVKSLHPVVPMNTFRTRYMNVIIPQMVIILLYGVFDISQVRTVSTLRERVIGRFPSFFSYNGRIPLFLLVAVLTVSSTYMFYKVYRKEVYKGKGWGYIQMHPFRLVPEYYRTIVSQYNSGNPFLLFGSVSKTDRFDEVVEIIDGWLKSGMSVEDASRKYGITVQQYKKYKKKSMERISFGAANYPVRVFLNPDNGVSGLKFFDIETSNSRYRFCYNGFLTGRENIIKNLQAGSHAYPGIGYPPFIVESVILGGGKGTR